MRKRRSKRESSELGRLIFSAIVRLRWYLKPIIILLRPWHWEGGGGDCCRSGCRSVAQRCVYVWPQGLRAHRPYRGFAAARTAQRALRVVVMPALAMDTVCCSITCGGKEKYKGGLRKGVIAELFLILGFQCAASQFAL